MKRVLLILLVAAAAGGLGFLVGRRVGQSDRIVEIATLQARIEQSKEAAVALETRLRREARADREREFVRFQAELDAQRDRRMLEDRLGIRIVGAAEDFQERPLLRPGEVYSGRAVRMDEVLHALGVVTDQLALYPDAVVNRSGLRRIVLAKDLRTGPYELGGFVTGFGQMYLDAGRSDEELARTFHHELFHLLDGKSFKGDWRDDAEWMALNPPGTNYAADQELMTDKQWLAVDGATRKGFISAYARWASFEDKAELFEWMAYRPNALDYRQDGDDVLVAKRKLLIRRLSTIDADFADSFWARARSAESKRKKMMRQRTGAVSAAEAPRLPDTAG